MPSPYAHIIAGTILATTRYPSKVLAFANKENMITLFAFSLLPDLDAIPGIIVGDIGAYHNQITHSLGFGLIACVVYILIRKMLPSAPTFRTMLLTTCAPYGLHVIMDGFTLGRGVMLLWPISSKRIIPPFNLFYGVRHSEGLFSYHHIITLATESLTLLPLLLITWALVQKHVKKQNTTS